MVEGRGEQVCQGLVAAVGDVCVEVGAGGLLSFLRPSQDSSSDHSQVSEPLFHHVSWPPVLGDAGVGDVVA